MLWLIYLLPIASFVLLCVFVAKIYLKLTVGRCDSPLCLIGKTTLVTGGVRGIGYQTALNLASRGCKVIIADKAEGEEVKGRIIEETNNPNVIFKKFDLASFDSVRKFAAEILETEERLDVLINNAGVSCGKNTTEDGLNEGLQINFFGHFLLTHLLIDLLIKTPSSRIIFLSSAMAYYNTLTIDYLHKTSFEGNDLFFTYGNSKLCSIIAAKLLAKKFKNRITSVSVHPGLVFTDINKSIPKDFLFVRIFFWTIRLIGSKTPLEGAQTSIYAAIAKDAVNYSGRFLGDCKPIKLPRKAEDDRFCLELWKACEEFIKLKDHEKILLKNDFDL